mgnify:CR=1 FL=1
MGTISGNATDPMSATQSSSVIVNNPQALEATLRGQQDNENVLSLTRTSLASHSQANQLNQHNHQRQSSCQHLQHQGTMSANCDNQTQVSYVRLVYCINIHIYIYKYLFKVSKINK